MTATEQPKRISLDAPLEFVDHCASCGLTPEAVLTAFMDDLGETEKSNGSDERRLAAAWFDRVVWSDTDRD